MRTSSYISLTEALKVCEDNEYHNAAKSPSASGYKPPDLTSQRVEILSQMHRYEEALDILMRELGDIEEAVRFVKRCGDDKA